MLIMQQKTHPASITNFKFIKSTFPELYRLANEMEYYYSTDHSCALLKARLFAEIWCHQTAQFFNLKLAESTDLSQKINQLKLLSKVPTYIIDELNLILNMEYPKKRGWVSDNYPALYDNKVMSIFSAQNYSIIETNSMMRWKNFSDVDTKLCYGANIYSEFLEQILRKSIIRYFLEQYHDNTRRDVIRCTFNELNEIASQSSGPTYVFSHIYVPHPPFIFGPNGENVIPDHRDISGLQDWENPQGYVNQVIYATNQVSIVIKNIVKKL